MKALGLAVVLITMTMASVARSDTVVPFGPIREGPDLDEAMQYYGGWLLRPADYAAQGLPGATTDEHRLGLRLDQYLQEFYIVAKIDLNGDGVDERIFLSNDGVDCGSGGCWGDVVEVVGDQVMRLCRIQAEPGGLHVTGRISPNGYREMSYGRTIVVWYGRRCEQELPLPWEVETRAR